MGLAVEFEIGGCANNALVEIVGRGSRGDGHLALDVEVVRSPLHWDPALAVLGVLDVLLLAHVPDGAPVPAWARTVLHGEQGREMGAWAVSGELSREADRLAYRAQFLDCRVRFEVGERVVRVEPYQIVAMPVGHRTVVTSVWAAGTGRGNAYWGVTTVAWEDEAAVDIQFCVELSGLERETNEHLSVEVAFSTMSQDAG